MVGEFLAAIPANAVGRFISAFDNGQLLKVFPVVGYIELLIYGLLCGIGLGVCHWFINNRMDDTKSPRTRGWLWIASWTVVILLELRFRSSPYNDPWIIQSMVLGLITGSIGGGIQLVTLRHTLKYAVIWVMSSGMSLMVGFAVFRFFVEDRLGFIYWEGTYDSSYYIGRLFQWAIYGLITGLTLEWMIRVTNRQRHM